MTQSIMQHTKITRLPHHWQIEFKDSIEISRHSPSAHPGSPLTTEELIIDNLCHAMITARQQVPSDCTDTKADKPHYAVILRRGKIPIQKKLPEFAAPVIEQLIREFPTALIAIVDADGREITVWSPAEVAAMARQFNAETVVQEVTPLINEPITPPIREFINRFQIAGHIKSSYFSMIAIH